MVGTEKLSRAEVRWRVNKNITKKLISLCSLHLLLGDYVAQLKCFLPRSLNENKLFVSAVVICCNVVCKKEKEDHKSLSTLKKKKKSVLSGGEMFSLWADLLVGAMDLQTLQIPHFRVNFHNVALHDYVKPPWSIISTLFL